MPTNFLAVCEALDLAIDVGATNAALRFAANLQTAHAAVLTGQVSRLRQVYTLYRDSRDPRAEECVKVLAAVDPYGCLDLYDYSVRRDARYSIEQRRTCLDEYFKGLEAKQAKRADAYRVALERLLANGDFALVVEVADVALDHRAMVIPSMDRALIWRSKAIAHEKRGEPEKADEAYRKGLGDITYMGRSELESMFQRSGQTGAKQTGAKQAGQGGANK
jgi:tetratricopeptide (TPR) repeat protein